MRQGLITMSTKESKKIHVIQQVIEKCITQAAAAAILSLSQRHVRRLVKNHKNDGIYALIHKSRGKPSCKKLPENIKDQIINLYKNKYTLFKPTHFTEKLNEEENIKVSKETVRQILIMQELWLDKPKKKKHRKQRQRKTHKGMLVQVDGSVDPWFEGRGPICVLISFIDDASSLVYAKFYEYEGTLPVMDALIGYIQEYGIPMALYTDLHQTYHVNNKTMTIEDELNNNIPVTKLEEAIAELGINITLAYSPQAKGRVERFFQTFQDRLKSELRLHKIDNIKDANIFLKKYLKSFNKKFAHPDLPHGDIHKPALPVAVLRKLLVVKHECHVSNDFTIRHNNHIYQILEPTIQKKVFLIFDTKGKTYIKEQNGKYLKFKFLKKLQSKSFLERKFATLNTKIDPVSLKETHA